MMRDRNNLPNLWIAMSRLCTPRLYCGPMFAEKYVSRNNNNSCCKLDNFQYMQLLQKASGY